MKRHLIIIAICVMLLALASTASAAPTAGNQGGCGRDGRNMTTVTCNVTDAGPGFVSGICEAGLWFDRVSTARTFKLDQVVTVRGCRGEGGELYAPIRISK